MIHDVANLIEWIAQPGVAPWLLFLAVGLVLLCLVYHLGEWLDTREPAIPPRSTDTPAPMRALQLPTTTEAK